MFYTLKEVLDKIIKEKDTFEIIQLKPQVVRNFLLFMGISISLQIKRIKTFIRHYTSPNYFLENCLPIQKFVLDDIWHGGL